MLNESPYNANYGRGQSWLYVDDYAWYVLAFLSVYEWLQDKRYLDVAKETYDFLHELAWDPDCGGHYWVVNPLPVASPPIPEKNAVTNLELLQAAAKLHLLTGEQQYLEHAQNTWHWLATAPIRDADGLLGDGLSGSSTVQCDCCNGTTAFGDKPICVRNMKPSYSYNQGLYLGGARLLLRATGDSRFATEATRTLRAVLQRMNCDGVLCEQPVKETPPALNVDCDMFHDPAGGDLYSFKGVFMLQLVEFLQEVPVASELQVELRAFVERSSDSAWAVRREPPWADAVDDVCADPAFADASDGPPKFPWYWTHVPRALVCIDARTQISALSLFTAELLLPQPAEGHDELPVALI